MYHDPPGTPEKEQHETDVDDGLSLIDMYADSGSVVHSNNSSNVAPTRQELTARRIAKNGTKSKTKAGPSAITSSDRANPRKRRLLILIGCVVVLGVVVAVVIAVVVSQRHNSATSGLSESPSSLPISGSDGSTVTMGNGTTFIYANAFGGDWQEDVTYPFSMGGKAQSWGKRIGMDDWVWGEDIVRGVNLGGWLVTEPFIVPALYEKYVGKSDIVVIDEWTLSLAMGDNLAQDMEEHYNTFITEKDIADIAAAGLNWVRIPIGFWAIETLGDEPFLVGTSWSYFLKAIAWCRKYGIRIYLDLHALPGSQNGWNHSGKAGSVNFMHGVMGIANAQRTLTYLRIITEFVSQEQYRDVVLMVGIVNEILWGTIGQTSVQSFYYAAYEAMRGATGIGKGNGPYIAIHEGFQGPAIWEGFMSGADRLALDQHPYLAFMSDYTSSTERSALKPCSWAVATNQSSKAFGVTVGGEWSVAVNNCGKWLNGIGAASDSNYDCDMWDDVTQFNASTIAALKDVALASMDALQNFFFWTWKIGISTELGRSSSPMWDYSLGRAKGWIPIDSREAIGHCAGILSSPQPFDGTFAASATGDASSIQPSPSLVFPPESLSPSFSGTQMGLLPTYTATGTVKTLFAPTFTSAPNVAVGDGWANKEDNEGAYVPVEGCIYADAWDATSAALPTAACTG